MSERIGEAMPELVGDVKECTLLADAALSMQVMNWYLEYLENGGVPLTFENARKALDLCERELKSFAPWTEVEGIAIFVRVLFSLGGV